MILHHNQYIASTGISVSTGFATAVSTEVEAFEQVAETNRILEEAGRHFWKDRVEGRELALLLLRRFDQTVAALKSCGWSKGRIRQELAPSRRVFATCSFMRRCQEWPRGYAGDFETIEYLAAGANQSLPGTPGWYIEEILLHSPVAQQHRNKLNCQSRTIARALMGNKTARVLSVACGGCLDWIPLLGCLKNFEGEIVLNDHDPEALEFAEQRLRSATTRYRLAPGNILRVAKRLENGPPFDLIVAGGLFDYLSDRAIAVLLRKMFHRLLTPDGVLLFTNIAEGNPWGYLMEFGSNWSLIERSEDRILDICRQSGIPNSAVSIRREHTGLALIATVTAGGKP